MQTTIRTVHSGAVRGRTHEHGSVFYGVPYAQGPTGAARFAPPVPHPGWSGIRDATRPGPTAPQSRRDSFGSLDMSAYFGSGWRRGADYLTVDVWAPGPSPDLVPVMVFVHGGGFLGGNSAAALYDGTSFNRDSVVLVTVNYRLGPAGFLHLSNAPDNRGMLDVAAAVRWVADNITEFGGDPTNITLFGQSAGATVASGVLTDPYSAGLARRAILQSSTSTITGQQASLVTAAFTAALDREPDAQALGEVSDDQLVAAVPALLGLDLRAATEHDPLGGITPFSLVLDHEPGHRMMKASAVRSICSSGRTPTRAASTSHRSARSSPPPRRTCTSPRHGSPTSPHSSSRPTARSGPWHRWVSYEQRFWAIASSVPPPAGWPPPTPTPPPRRRSPTSSPGARTLSTEPSGHATSSSCRSFLISFSSLRWQAPVGCWEPHPYRPNWPAESIEHGSTSQPPAIRDGHRTRRQLRTCNRSPSKRTWPTPPHSADILGVLRHR